jgi:hypothetical protein
MSKKETIQQSRTLRKELISSNNQKHSKNGRPRVVQECMYVISDWDLDRDIELG